jgi:ribosomal protein L22
VTDTMALTRIMAIRSVAEEALDNLRIAQVWLDNHVASSGDSPRGRGSDIAIEKAIVNIETIIKRCNDRVATGDHIHGY